MAKLDVSSGLQHRQGRLTEQANIIEFGVFRWRFSRVALANHSLVVHRGWWSPSQPGNSYRYSLAIGPQPGGVDEESRDSPDNPLSSRSCYGEQGRLKTSLGDTKANNHGCSLFGASQGDSGDGSGDGGDPYCWG